jgi:hypothetical protein
MQFASFCFSPAEYGRILMEGVDITPFYPNPDLDACLDVALDITGKNEEQVNAELTHAASCFNEYLHMV